MELVKRVRWSVIAQHAVKGLVVATCKIPAEKVRAAVRICERSGIWMRHFHIRFEDGEGTRAGDPVLAEEV